MKRNIVWCVSAVAAIIAVIVLFLHRSNPFIAAWGPLISTALVVFIMAVWAVVAGKSFMRYWDRPAIKHN